MRQIIRPVRRAGAVLCVLLAAFTLMPPAFAQTLHAVIIADTSDFSIGISVRKDYDRNVALMRAIAANTGMTLNLKEITGAQLTIANVRNAVSGLRVAANDTVVFYYSGHGYRLWKKEDKYPFLYISQQGLDFHQLVKDLRAKKPRLLLAVTDSCNEYADKRPEARAMMMQRQPPKYNYRRLWLEAKGEIVIASSSQGEFAWGDDIRGGYFTERFHKSHETEVERAEPAWETILTAARRPIVVSAGGTSYTQQPLIDSQIVYATQTVAAGAAPVATRTAAVAPAALAWIAAANGAIPQGALPGGQAQGRSLAICRMRYGQGSNIGVHPGLVAGQACAIGWGGREVRQPQYEVLVVDGNTVAWVASANGAVPKNAVIGGQEPARQLPVCRAHYNNAVVPGKVVARNCNIAWAGREILVPRYEVLVTK